MAGSPVAAAATVTSPTSRSSSATALPPLSVLLSAPSLDPYIAQLDEATLAQLYNQPPPLGASPTSTSASAVYSSPAAVDSLRRIDSSLAACIDAAFKLSLHLDAGPAAASSTIGGTNEPLSLEPSVSSLLSSLASLDGAARHCDLVVPQSLLASIDEGRNPERGLAELLEQLISSNDRARGRAIATHFLTGGIEAYVEAAAARERDIDQQPHSQSQSEPQQQAKHEQDTAME